MVEDLGDWVEPYLKGLHEHVMGLVMQDEPVHHSELQERDPETQQFLPGEPVGYTPKAEAEQRTAGSKNAATEGERKTLGLPVETAVANQFSGKERVQGDINMTKTQRIILAIGLILFLASAILPPWRDHDGILGPFALLTSTGVTQLDIHRLLIEWVITTVLTGGLLLLTTKGKSQ